MIGGACCLEMSLSPLSAPGSQLGRSRTSYEFSCFVVCKSTPRCLKRFFELSPRRQTSYVCTSWEVSGIGRWRPKTSLWMQRRRQALEHAPRDRLLANMPPNKKTDATVPLRFPKPAMACLGTGKIPLRPAQPPSPIAKKMWPH